MSAPETVLDDAWAAAHLPERPSHGHKGTFGTVLVVAGSLEYAGAALLAGLGAARTGAGLVRLAVPESVGVAVLGRIPELTMLLLAEEGAGIVSPVGWRQLETAATESDSVVIGPGLGRHQATLRRTRQLIQQLRRPTVVDADGLMALAEQERWWKGIRASLVLTPHPVEFGRLMRGAGGVPPDDDEVRMRAARTAAALWEQVVVLKGARTVVAAPDSTTLLSTVATPALASGGSGDVLAGAVGALLAAGLTPLDAAGCAVAIHGAAGELAESRIGTAGVLASDVAGLIPTAMAAIRSGARA
jgi:NAD(P)H-hydrate epimerase